MQHAVYSSSVVTLREGGKKKTNSVCHCCDVVSVGCLADSSFSLAHFAWYPWLLPKTNSWEGHVCSKSKVFFFFFVTIAKRWSAHCNVSINPGFVYYWLAVACVAGGLRMIPMCKILPGQCRTCEEFARDKIAALEEGGKVNWSVSKEVTTVISINDVAAF